MNNIRLVAKKIASLITSDGAGVVLRRSIGTKALSELDPFLLLDAFGTENPGDYIAGFPDHPHRGFETVTYMVAGSMRHRDSNGDEGVLLPGGVQWMTAGKGIIHSEMPEQTEGEMRGFQLWLNLPSKEKMKAPCYQQFEPYQLPIREICDGIRVRVIVGSVDDFKGPVAGGSTEPLYIDIHMKKDSKFTQLVPSSHTCFVYVYEGEVSIIGDSIPKDTLAVLGHGDSVILESPELSKVILVAARPINEPVVRYGPFVMNTREEIEKAIDDFRSGHFVS